MEMVDFFLQIGQVKTFDKLYKHNVFTQVEQTFPSLHRVQSSPIVSHVSQQIQQIFSFIF